MSKPVLVVLAAALLCVAAELPCDDDYAFYPDLEGTEEPTQPQFSGSCLKLFKTTDAFFPLASPSKSFAVAAIDFCSFVHSGGRLLSFSSPSTSANSLLTRTRSLISSAGTNLVLLGGIQNPNAKGTPKHQNWIWTDANTDPSIINVSPLSVDSLWAANQPEYVRVGLLSVPSVGAWLLAG
jgi:hypothetical protein